MLNFKNEKGSITLFVLVSCMFFIASVTCVHMYMQSKQVSVNREYRQIKANYEANMADTNSLKEAYYQLSQIKNLNIMLEKTTYQNNQLIVEFTLNNTENIEVKTAKYGWGTNTSIDTVTEWNYIESGSVNDKMIAVYNHAATTGDYHLFVVIDNQDFYQKITI